MSFSIMYSNTDLLFYTNYTGQISKIKMTDVNYNVELKLREEIQYKVLYTKFDF